MQPGDTLSAIAKKFLGNANDYMDIFNANRDQLTDPDKIKPGQVLKIPQHARSSPAEAGPSSEPIDDAR